jgi:hypothetical protein
VLVILAHYSKAFSLPGLIPKSYQKDDKLDFFVGPLTSRHGSLPKDFYDLPWCPGKEGVTGAYKGTPFTYKMGNNTPGTETCKKSWTKQEIDQF